MNRRTIDFGIDLGTTNSAIAVLSGTTPEIFKDNDNNDVTASAVYIDKHGTIKIGYRAKDRLKDDNTADDVYVEFKRLMGTEHQYNFKNAQRKMNPEELSAEVLKSLRSNVQRKLLEEIQSAVITVPAAFEQKQCAATRKAGEMAGLLQCPLLQEPVAAALAHGFQAEVTKEYWLIYDFGGGTFDAAIMKAEDGTINVVNHGGDNHLGGSDIDWAIVEQIVIPELVKNYNLPGFSRGNIRWRTALARIKHAAEEAKIGLSANEAETLEAVIKDVDSKEVKVDFRITRNALIRVAEPIIMRSVKICEQVLKQKNLSPQAIEKMILVGGPTSAPYFREILQANLGIPLDFSEDPLTVVARGAAVFARTQKIEGKKAPKAAIGQYDINLQYTPIDADEEPRVSGNVNAVSGVSVEGFTIEFINQQTHWRSGKIPIKENGRFRLSLLAEKGFQNIFTIELLDRAGRRQVVVPDSLTYTIGMAISEQPIINSIAVALADNTADVFFKKGEPLPAKTMRIYRSTHMVKKGSNDHILNVPVVEGEIEQADRNRLLGRLIIKGTEVRRDVPAGSEVEVTLLYDASRMIRAKAYIPVLDEEYEAIIDHDRASPDPAALHKEYEREVDRLETLREKGNQAEDEKAIELLDEVEESKTLETIESLLVAAKADLDAAKNAEARLLDIKIKIDKAENALEWPALSADANRRLDELDELLEEHGTSEQREKAIKLRNQTEELIAQKRIDPLRRRIDQVVDLHRDILFEQPGFWLGFFNHLTEEQENMNDKATARRLFSQGQQCIAQGNVQGLRSVVKQLLDLIPQNIAEEIKRGYQSSLLK